MHIYTHVRVSSPRLRIYVYIPRFQWLREIKGQVVRYIHNSVIDIQSQLFVTTVYTFNEIYSVDIERLRTP